MKILYYRICGKYAQFQHQFFKYTSYFYSLECISEEFPRILVISLVEVFDNEVYIHNVFKMIFHMNFFSHRMCIKSFFQKKGIFIADIQYLEIVFDKSFKHRNKLKWITYKQLFTRFTNRFECIRYPKF